MAQCYYYNESVPSSSFDDVGGADYLTDDSEIEEEMQGRQRKRHKSRHRRDEEDDFMFEDFIKRRPYQSVDQFLEKFKPSSTSPDRGSWIYTESPGYHKYTSCEQEQLSLMEGKIMLQRLEQQQFNRLSMRDQFMHAQVGRSSSTFGAEVLTTTAVESQLYSIARSHQYTTGKWLLFGKTHTSDAMWNKVAKATFDGRLGIAAKVATNNGSGSFAICVYCRDFDDIFDIGRVFRVLKHDLKLNPTTFKADYFAALDITGDINKLGLKLVKYSARDFSAMDNGELTLSTFKAPIETILRRLPDFAPQAISNQQCATMVAGYEDTIATNEGNLQIAKSSPKSHRWNSMGRAIASPRSRRSGAANIARRKVTESRNPSAITLRFNDPVAF